MKAGGFNDKELEEYHDKKLQIESLFSVPPAQEPLNEKTGAFGKGYNSYGRPGYKQSFRYRI